MVNAVKSALWGWVSCLQRRIDNDGPSNEAGSSSDADAAGVASREKQRRQRMVLFVCLSVMTSFLLLTLPLEWFFHQHITVLQVSNNSKQSAIDHCDCAQENGAFTPAGIPTTRVCYLVATKLCVAAACVLCAALLALFGRIEWPRRLLFCASWVVVPVALHSLGGFEHSTAAADLGLGHLLITVVLYDRLVPVMLSFCFTCSMFIAYGIYEVQANPHAQYAVARENVVIETCIRDLLMMTMFLLFGYGRSRFLRHQMALLEQAKCAALEGMREKASFLACMSHEIRSPVCHILSVAFVLSVLYMIGCIALKSF